MFKDADADNSGFVEFKEFCGLMKALDPKDHAGSAKEIAMDRVNAREASTKPFPPSYTTSTLISTFKLNINAFGGTCQG